MSVGPYTQRAIAARPVRTLLTLASIVIGVSAVVAVTIVTASTRESYRLLFATVKGAADLEVSASSGASISEEWIGVVDQVPGVRAAVPLVRQLSAMTVGERRVRLQCLGIDPERDHFVRQMEIVSGRALRPGDEDDLLLESDFARQLGIQSGDTVRILTRKRFVGEPFGPVPMRVVGLVKVAGANPSLQLGVAFLTFTRCQQRFIGPGKVDAIQIVAAENSDPKALATTIQAKMDAGIEVHPPSGSATVLEGTLDASEQGLRLATVFSLVMAGFIVLNTFMMNVSERRRHFAIMRVIGARRNQILFAILRESLLLGMLGTLIGIGIGLVAAWLLTDLLSRSLEVSLPPATRYMTMPLPYLLGVVFGLVMSVFGSLVPAWRSRAVSPAEGLSWVAPSDFAVPSWRWLVTGMLMMVIGGALIAAGIGGFIWIDAPIYGAASLLIGVVLVLPFGLNPLVRIAAWPGQWVCRVETDLAVRQVLRHRGRSALTAGVLFIAGSTGVGMAYSILDNVHDVKDWYRQVLIGDYYLRAMVPDFASGVAADLPDELDGEFRNISSIAYLDRVKLFEAEVRRPPVTAMADAGDREYWNVIFVAREFNEPGKLPLDLVSGEASLVRSQLATGDVVIGTVLANSMHVAVGDSIEIFAVDGRRTVRICGVTNEYMAGGQGIYMDWSSARSLFAISGVDGYIIRAKTNDLLALQPQLEALAKKYGILLHSSADIRREIDRITAGVVGGLWGLVSLGFVVASFGVANTLSMSVVEQTRELGLLRMIAMTRRQVRRTILAQATIIGAVGLVPGLGCGVVVAYVINLSMEPSFGRPIAFGFHPWVLFFTLCGSLVLVLLAAGAPAERAARLNVCDAIRYE